MLIIEGMETGVLPSASLQVHRVREKPPQKHPRSPSDGTHSEGLGR